MESVNCENVVEYIKYYEFLKNLYDKNKLYQLTSETDANLICLYNAFNDFPLPFHSHSNGIIIPWFLTFIGSVQARVIETYNDTFNTNLSLDPESFIKNYKIIKNNLRIKILDAASDDLLGLLIDRESDTVFLIKHISFVVQLALHYASYENLEVSKNNDFVTKPVLIKMITEILKRFDPSRKLAKEFVKFVKDGNLVSYKLNNFEVISEISGVDIHPEECSAFYDIESGKIFYEQHNTLFDVAVILHEFGHYISRNVKKENPINELFSLTLEKMAIQYFRDTNVSLYKIKPCVDFRNELLADNASEILFPLMMVEKKLSNDPVITDADRDNVYKFLGNPDLSSVTGTIINGNLDLFKPSEIINHFIDRQNTNLLSNHAFERIIDLVPYLVSSYIADYIVENGKEHLLFEMLDEKYLSTEDVFNTLGISLDEMILK